MQIYPDMGVAAILKNQWQDTDFSFASLSDRSPVSEDDDLVVLAAPDPQGVQHKRSRAQALLHTTAASVDARHNDLYVDCHLPSYSIFGLSVWTSSGQLPRF